MRCLIAALLALVMLLSSPVCAKELHEKKWLKATSANFEIYSRMGERDSLDLLRHLEVLRRMLAMTDRTRVKSPVRTLIVVAGNRKEFELLGGDRDLGGLFLSGIRRNHILMRELRGMDEAGIVLHEYTHFLLHNSSSFHYPEWYQEGYAELLGQTEIKRGSVYLFGHPEERIWSLSAPRWLPAEQLIDPESVRSMTDEEQRLFYAQSWALVHFLANRGDDKPSTEKGLIRYSELRAAGTDKIKSFERAFDLDITTLNRGLRSYVFDDCCRVRKGPVEQFLEGFLPVVERAAPADAALALGQMSDAFGKHDVARDFFTGALLDDSTRAKAHAGLAHIDTEEDDLESARRHIEEALELDMSDAEVLLDHAVWYANYAPGSDDVESLLANDAIARRSFDAIAAQGDETPEYYLHRARFAIGADGDMVAALDLLSRSYQILPSDRTTQMLLATHLANLGRHKEALDIAEQIKSWSFERPQLREWATDFIEKLRYELAAIESSSEQQK